MRLSRLKCGVLLAAGVLSLAGCFRKDASELHYCGDAELDYYKDVATTIDYPNLESTTPSEVVASTEPHSLFDRRKDEIWDLSLAQALQLALANNRIIRSASGFLSPGNQLLSNPNAAESIYDPALQETGVLFGGRGVEAALADFDTTFSTSLIWGRNELVQNNAFISGGVLPGSTQVSETAAFNAALVKQNAYGGTMELDHVWNYLGTNTPGTLFPSSYTGYIQAQYRQPLWAGAGPEYTRIAGPIGQGFAGVTGVSQGVVIARINSDIVLSDFELAVHNLLRDTELTYWDLYLAYRLYHTAVVAHNSALRSWREAKAKLEVGGVTNFKPVDEAQARDQLYQTRALAQQALTDIYTNETRLRRLLGLPVNDGRVIRPADEPTTAKFVPDWFINLAEALTRRVELRKQKWTIKSLELQLRAAESLLNPRLDFVSGYRVNGFGDVLLGGDDSDNITAQGLHNAYETITQGNQTGWNLGFQFSMPIGFRQAHAQVRNYELRLVKAREGLATQEMDIAQELAVSFQSVAGNYHTAQSSFNRRVAAERRVELYQAELTYGTATLDLVLRAQASLADAERDYYTSLVNYAKAIMDLHYRKGTILDYDNVALAESEWTPEAYRDALRRAWARSYALDNPCLGTAPEEFAIPNVGGHAVMEPAASGELAPPPAVPDGPAPDANTPGAPTTIPLPPPAGPAEPPQE
jgi:outer membrane protein TolC